MSKRTCGNDGSRESTPRVDHHSTRSIHVSSEPDPKTGAVVPSLSVSTTFKQDGVGLHRGHEYSRTSNPTRSDLETLLTSLETWSATQSPAGGETLVFASGSAATAALAHWVSLSSEEGGAGGEDGKTGGGGHILAVNDVYGGTARYLTRAAKSTGLEVTFLDMDQAGEEGIRQAIRPDTRVVWLEVPTNPLLIVPPLPLIASIVYSLPVATRPLILVDTTFLSSFYITPLVPVAPKDSPLADIVLSSLSKYSSGHSDIILGSLTLSPTLATTSPHVLKGLRFLQNSLGAAASPRDCHLLIRSLKTLSVRMVQHGLNALRISDWLSNRDDVEEVRYPGLKGDAGFHRVEQLLSPNARKSLEFLGWNFPFSIKQDVVENASSLAYLRTVGIPFGGVFAFRLKGRSGEETDKFVSGLRLIALAESLGGVESLVEVPAGMTHAVSLVERDIPDHYQGLPEATREALGITSNLIRFSVGIEDADDLIADLQAGLESLR
ncbi:hypothetical protein P7C73_g1740, partial [Tremellales sp. Uapishka_1]